MWLAKDVTSLSAEWVLWYSLDFVLKQIQFAFFIGLSDHSLLELFSSEDTLKTVKCSSTSWYLESVESNEQESYHSKFTSYFKP